MLEMPEPFAVEFSPAGYARLIRALRDRRYVVRSFSDADPSHPHLVVRHDVDFSLNAALSMAVLERELGVASVYFVLLRTEFYNVMSAESLSALEAIANCGHEIGLHFDAALYESGQLNAAVARECELLERVLERPVRSLSLHRPAKDNLGAENEIAGRLNAYGARFVSEMGYCSDSRGEWRHGHPIDHAAVRDGRALQLLIHPFWWQDPPMGPQERLLNFHAERAEFLDRELERNCVIHRPTRRPQTM